MKLYIVLAIAIFAFFSTPTFSSPTVHVEAYIESLCPYCQAFVNGPLADAVGSVLPIMNLTIVPYGNAKESQLPDGTWQFTCQHGEAECRGNMLEACAINFLPSASDHFPYLHCMESLLSQKMDPDSAAKQCASQIPGIPYFSILSCASGPLGNQLMHQNALATMSLNPPKQGVPWVVVNGDSSDETQDAATTNLVELVCKLYQGADKPPACSQ